jgi:hypothetical protein
MSTPDARCANWRFVVPDEPSGMLVLDAARASRGSCVNEAIGGAQAPAVVVPDISAWTHRAGSRGVLREVARGVAPSGWLCVGFANRLSPAAPQTRAALSLPVATATLKSAGLVVQTVYLPLPNHRRPAYLIDARHRATLDYVLRHLFLTYLPGSSALVRPGRKGLALARQAALALPHRLRVLAAPGYFVLARRSHD